MATRQRVPSTGAPTLTSAAQPDYSGDTSRTYTGTVAVPRYTAVSANTGEVVAMSGPRSTDSRARTPQIDPATGLITGSLYTGTVAIPRNAIDKANWATPEQISDAVTRAADQRSTLYGLGAGGSSALVDYYNRTGEFPDLSALTAGNYSPGGDTWGLDRLMGEGLSGSTLYVVAGLVGLALILILRK